MPLLRYLKETGQIVGVYEASLPDMLTAQVDTTDPAWGFVLLDAPFPVHEQERWEVHQGQVQARQEVVLQATPATFAADGRTRCTITRTPCIACALWVANQTAFLADTDTALTVTVDSPGKFFVRLAPMAGYWAQPVLLEAI